MTVSSNFHPLRQRLTPPTPIAATPRTMKARTPNPHFWMIMASIRCSMLLSKRSLVGDSGIFSHAARSFSMDVRPIWRPTNSGAIATTATVIGTQISSMAGGYR